jgi:hypothetical protein
VLSDQNKYAVAIAAVLLIKRAIALDYVPASGASVTTVLESRVPQEFWVQVCL